MKTFNIILILVVLKSVSVSESARILAFFPTPSISHQVVFRPVTRELAKRGHEVVVITPDPAYSKGETPENLTEIDVHDISYKAWKELVLTGATTTGNTKDFVKQTSIVMPLISKMFEIQMGIEEVQQVINNRTNHFDLILGEAIVRPVVSLSYVFNAPVILISSFIGIMSNYDVMGAPMRPVLHYPTAHRQKVYDLSLWDKLLEFCNHYALEYIYMNIENEANEMVKRLFGLDIPTISELENNVRLLMLNAHPVWENNRPVPPGVVYIGGIHLNPSKELPKELKKYLDSSRRGVIYVSFGTNVDPASLPPERIQILTRVFSQLPYDVLWKWPQDELPGKSENIRISKWLPQSDLLKHQKIKLFIMQGGLQSIDEAITAGVPLIGIPFLGDQWYNTEQISGLKIGIKLRFDELTEKTFRDSINTILNDDSYRQNIVRLGAVMRDQPEPPLQRAAWWVEHVLRHGGAPHLRATVANMPWTDYLDLPFMALLTSILITTISVVTYTLYIFVRLMRKYVFYVKLKTD